MMFDCKQEYREFTIIRDSDGYYSVYRNDELCGIYTTYSQALDSVDKFYIYFGGKEC